MPNNINVDDLQDLTDLFEYTEIVKHSKANQNEVDDLVKSIKKGRWNKTRQMLD